MKLTINHHHITFPDEFIVVDEQNHKLYGIESKLWWGHQIVMKNIHDEEIGRIDDGITNIMPVFKIIINDEDAGYVKRVLSLKQKRYDIHFQGWMIRGLMEEDHFDIVDRHGKLLAHYNCINGRHVFDILQPKYHQQILLFVIAVKAIQELE